MAYAQLVCATVCPPIANLTGIELAVMAVLTIGLFASAFWPARSA